MTLKIMPWTAEHRVTFDQAKMLGRKNFDLPCESVTALGEGWDYINFLADNEWVLRFPKRADCNTVLLREKGFLDLLEQTTLPLQVPHIQQLAEPGDAFPWHSAAYRFLPGIPLSEFQGAKVPAHIPAAIGEFLAALHEVSPEAEWRDPWADDVDDSWSRREFDASLPAYTSALRTRMEAFLERSQPEAPDLPSVLTHADLNAEHILIEQSTGRVSGIIDWADAHTSFRSRDFVGLYYLGGLACASQAYKAYGAEPDDAEWRWIEHAAIEMCIGQIFYGWNAQKPEILNLGLERADSFLS